MDTGSIVRPTYEIASTSEKPATKTRCGDHGLAHELTDESLVVLVLSDGVGSRQNDWKTSRAACRSFLLAFEKSEGDVWERMSAGLTSAHEQVRDDPSLGLATLVAVCWRTDAPVAHVVSVGDSRLYRVRPGDVEQVSQDDSRAVTVRSGGELVSMGGALVTSRGLTKAVGQPGDLEVEPEECSLGGEEMLVLATDGCYRIEGFESRMIELYSRPALAPQLRPILYRGYGSESQDDASAILLRRRQLSSGQRERYRSAPRENLDPDRAGLARHLLAAEMVAFGHEIVGTRDLEGLDRWVSYCESHRIWLATDRVRDLLDDLVEIPGSETLARRLVKLCGRS